jgi:ribose-phosphate pyrophosphokinase
MEIIGEVKGKRAVMIDDIIDTAGSVTTGAQALVERGASEVWCCCTHAILSGSAIERIQNSPIQGLFCTNTINLPVEKRIPKIRTISVAHLLAEAIWRIHDDRSVSELFAEYA